MAEVELWEPRELEELEEDQIHRAAGLLAGMGLLLYIVGVNFRLLAGRKERGMTHLNNSPCFNWWR